MIQQCQYHIKDAETAKDLSQEVFLRALTKLHSYRQEAPFSAWLGTIVRNRCADHLKQQKHVVHREVTLKIAAAVEEEINTDSLTKPTVEILEELMDKISSEERLILLLKYKQKWSVQAIGQALQLSEGTVKMRLSRVKMKMQKLLEKYNKV